MQDQTSRKRRSQYQAKRKKTSVKHETVALIKQGKKGIVINKKKLLKYETRKKGAQY